MGVLAQSKMSGMGHALVDAFIAGASSVLDLSPPAKAPVPPNIAIAQYWGATGMYLWHGVDTQRELYEAQSPLFDASAFALKQSR